MLVWVGGILSNNFWENLWSAMDLSPNVILNYFLFRLISNICRELAIQKPTFISQVISKTYLGQA